MRQHIAGSETRNTQPKPFRVYLDMRQPLALSHGPMEPAPVKRKRRFEWTPARRAAFEKCRKAREAKLASSRSGNSKSRATPVKESASVEEAREQARRVLEALRKQGAIKSKPSESEPEPPTGNKRGGKPAADESVVLDQVLRNLDDKVAKLVQVHLATTAQPKPKPIKPKRKQAVRKVKVKVEEDPYPSESEESQGEASDEDVDDDEEEDDDADTYETPVKQRKRAPANPRMSTAKRAKVTVKRERKAPGKHRKSNPSDDEYDDVEPYNPNRFDASRSSPYSAAVMPQPMFRFL